MYRFSEEIVVELKINTNMFFDHFQTFSIEVWFGFSQVIYHHHRGLNNGRGASHNNLMLKMPMEFLVVPWRGFQSLHNKRKKNQSRFVFFKRSNVCVVLDAFTRGLRNT